MNKEVAFSQKQLEQQIAESAKKRPPSPSPSSSSAVELNGKPRKETRKKSRMEGSEQAANFPPGHRSKKGRRTASKKERKKEEEEKEEADLDDQMDDYVREQNAEALAK